ncbi:PrgI family protein, partial [Streptococcus suis]
MAYVQIPKDLSKVKTKIAFNLTKRQLIGFAVAGFVSLPVYLSIRESV